jgi:hypothetical protein
MMTSQLKNLRRQRVDRTTMALAMHELRGVYAHLMIELAERMDAPCLNFWTHWSKAEVIERAMRIWFQISVLVPFSPPISTFRRVMKNVCSREQMQSVSGRARFSNAVVSIWRKGESRYYVICSFESVMHTFNLTFSGLRSILYIINSMAYVTRRFNAAFARAL